VSSAAFEDVFPVARALARQKASTAIGRCGLTADDRDDVASQLVTRFYLRFRKYDGRRASVRTFASRVMDKELASILRYRMAVCRRQHAESGLLSDSGEAADATSRVLLKPAERQEFWIDVERALTPFSHVLLDTARALASHTPSELSRMPGQSRTLVYRRMHRLRSALLAAGIGPDYFSPAGGAGNQAAGCAPAGVCHG
jgi:hypothetical protein